MVWGLELGSVFFLMQPAPAEGRLFAQNCDHVLFFFKSWRLVEGQSFLLVVGWGEAREAVKAQPLCTARRSA